MYLCCIFTHLLNRIWGWVLKSWDWTSLRCCSNKGFWPASDFSMVLRYVEPESWRKTIGNLHLSGDWGGGSYLEIFPNIIYQLAPALEDPEPKAKTIVAEKDSTHFFAHLGRLHAPQRQRNPSIVWELSFLNWKTKVAYFFSPLICVSFSFLLLAVQALQTEPGKKKKMQLGLSRRDNQPGAGGSLESTLID